MTDLSDNDVIEDANAENLGGLNELLVNRKIGGAGLKVAGRVVMGEDDGGGTVGDHVGKNFARMDLATV